MQARSTLQRNKAVKSAFASKVAVIPGVHGAYAKESPDGTLHLWTVVGKDKLAVREQIYDAEARLMAEFPEARLDFYVLTLYIPPDGSVEKAIPTGFSKVAA